MVRTAALTALALALSGCGETPAPAPTAEETQAAEDAQRVEQAKASISAGLKDPESARFSRIFVSRKSGLPVVCGMVNAKNSFGGYVGDMPFYSAGVVGIVATESTYPTFKASWDELCQSN